VSTLVLLAIPILDFARPKSKMRLAKGDLPPALAD